MWGRPTSTLYGDPQSFTDAIHPEDRTRVVAAFERQAVGTYDEEYRVIRPDGSVRWVRDRAFPLRDSEGRVYRLAGLVADITQAKNHQAQIETLNDELEARVEARTAELALTSESLRQAQKMEAVGRLAGGIAHDFNNLLAVILSYAELAIDAVGDGHEAIQDINEILNAAERASDLTRRAAGVQPPPGGHLHGARPQRCGARNRPTLDPVDSAKTSNWSPTWATSCRRC